MQKRLIGLGSENIVHTKDKSYQEKLNKIPGFKKLIEHTVVGFMEKYAAVEYLGNGININSISNPKLHSSLLEAAKILDIKEIPEFSADWHYAINSFSVGEQKKRIVILSGTVDLLNNEELQFILGHELGHMKCNHMTYLMLTESLFLAAQNTIVMSAIIAIVKMPLLDWYRISDFTADRAGLLCCQDIKVALSTMIKMAGLPKSHYNQININSFIQQARDFKKNATVVDEVVKYFSINGASHPWLVLRASELLDWYESGQYNSIVEKYSKQSLWKYQ